MMPVREKGLSMKAEQWFARTVFLAATPGSTLLRPPENPAKKWGSMNPSAHSRSASTAMRFKISSPPEGSAPSETKSPASSQL